MKHLGVVEFVDIGVLVYRLHLLVIQPKKG